jgi:hypothetical protein
MRRTAAMIAIAALLSLPVMVLAAEQFTASLTPEDEVPAPTLPAGYSGSGSASVTISDDATQIEYEVTYDNLTGPPVGAHIHWGAVGEAGPVILPLAHGDSPFSGTLTEADFAPAPGGPQTFAEALDAMREGDTYINVHTEDNQPGEIRGQLRVVPDTATEDAASSPAAGTPVLLLALVALAAFLVAARRFSLRRA